MTPSVSAPPETYSPQQTGRGSRLSPPGGVDADTPWPYLAALGRRKKLLVALPILFATVAGASSLSRARLYLAKAAFVASEPSSPAGSIGALSSVATSLGIPQLSALAANTASGSAQFYGDLLNSTAVLHALVTTTYDASTPGEYGGAPFKGTLIQYFHSSADTPTDVLLAAMKRVSRSVLAVGVDRPTGIVRFSVRTKNRQLSALVTRRLLELVNDFNLRRRQTQAGAEREFDLRRAQAASDSLRAAEAALADFRATNIDFSRSPRLATRETELQRRVTMAQQIYTTISQRYELANIEAVRNTPVVTVLDGPEGLVEAQPRYTVVITMAAFAIGLVIAMALALTLERITELRSERALAAVQ